MRQAKFRNPRANVRYTDGRDVRWVRNDTIAEARRHANRNHRRIYRLDSDDDPRRQRRGLRFDDPAPIVDSIGTALRKRGANFVVVIAHAGRAAAGTEGRSAAEKIIDLARRLTTKG